MYFKFSTFWWKRWPSQLRYFRSYGLQKTWLHQRPKSPVSEEPSKSNIVNGPKHCSNLNDSTFSIFINHWEGNDLLKVSISDTKNLRLFVNTLTADQKYSLLNRDSLTQPTQMQLSQNEKIFVRIFFSTFEI